MLKRTVDDIAMEYALTVPVNPSWEKSMYTTKEEQAAEDLFQEMVKLSDPVTASAAITQARHTLKMVGAMPPDRDNPYI